MKEKTNEKRKLSVKLYKLAAWPLLALILLIPKYSSADTLQTLGETQIQSLRFGETEVIKVGNTFTNVSGTLTDIDATIRHNGTTPAGDVEVDIYLWTGTGTTGSSLSHGELSSGSVTSSFSSYNIAMDELELDPGEDYIIVFGMSGSAHGSNYYHLGADTTMPYADGRPGWKDATTWTYPYYYSFLVDPDFVITLNGTTEEAEEPTYVDPALFASPALNLYTYASSTCNQIGTSTPAIFKCYASSTPAYTQDAGNLSFALAILITMQSLMLVGYTYNTISNKKKQWR